MSGTVRAGFAFPWAGAMFSPGTQAMEAIDYSAHRELTFRVRGDGRTYQAMLLAGTPGGGAPASVEFATNVQWRQVRVPLADFVGADRERVWAIGFNAGLPPGEFWFEIDDVAVTD